MTWSAAAAFGVREQAVVNDHITLDLVNAGCLDLAGQIVNASQRVLRRQRRVNRPIGVRVIGVLKGNLSLLRRAATKRQIATRHKNQIAIERSYVVHGAAAMDGR